MAALQHMYRAYKRGEGSEEMARFPDVDLKRAEEDAAQDRSYRDCEIKYKKTQSEYSLYHAFPCI
eukprot:3425063-Rhodomonas_salina.5